MSTAASFSGDNAAQNSTTPDGQSEILRMHLKWFNASKGFGFLVPEDNSFDAFVHVTILQDAGLNSAGEGAIFDCEVYEGDKGKQVRRITQVIDSGAAPTTITPSEHDGMPVIGGIVKWYKPEKGFGFVIADDGQKDIFVHKSLLQKADLETLSEGQRVRVTVKSVDKGREAAAIEVLDSF